MFQAKSMLYVYVETPLHSGSGKGLGAVDLPIQRERTTDYPIVQASSLKGCLRAEANGKITPNNDFLAIFGPEAANASDYAGALSCGDARLLLFPVRSLAGVFAWTTSLEALAHFERSAAAAGMTTGWNLAQAGTVGSDQAWINGDVLLAGGAVVLEEFSFSPDRKAIVNTIGTWLADNALPQLAEYTYWHDALPKKLCILPDNAFRDFALYATEVQTHIKLNPATKTVDGTALWTSESLPADTLLYSPLMASNSRSAASQLNAAGVLQTIKKLGLTRIQLGGDETTGQGLVALRFS